MSSQPDWHVLWLCLSGRVYNKNRLLPLKLTAYDALSDFAAAVQLCLRRATVVPRAPLPLLVAIAHGYYRFSEAASAIALCGYMCSITCLCTLPRSVVSVMGAGTDAGQSPPKVLDSTLRA